MRDAVEAFVTLELKVTRRQCLFQNMSSGSIIPEPKTILPWQQRAVMVSMAAENPRVSSCHVTSTTSLFLCDFPDKRLKPSLGRLALSDHQFRSLDVPDRFDKPFTLLPSGLFRPFLFLTLDLASRFGLPWGEHANYTKKSPQKNYV